MGWAFDRKSGSELGKAARAKHGRALKALLPEDLPIRTVSQIYRQKIEHGSRNDFAAVQIYPDQSAAPALGCASTPMPNFNTPKK